MTTKDWLNRARNIDQEIQALNRAQQDAYDACISTTTTLKSDVVSCEKDPHAKLERWAELSGMIDGKLDELVEIKKEILQAIWKVQDTTYRTLLTERYVNFQSWEKISVVLNYSYKHVVMTLHPRALREVEEQGKVVIEGNIA